MIWLDCICSNGTLTNGVRSSAIHGLIYLGFIWNNLYCRYFLLVFDGNWQHKRNIWSLVIIFFFVLDVGRKWGSSFWKGKNWNTSLSACVDKGDNLVPSLERFKRPNLVGSTRDIPQDRAILTHIHNTLQSLSRSVQKGERAGLWSWWGSKKASLASRNFLWSFF